MRGGGEIRVAEDLDDEDRGTDVGPGEGAEDERNKVAEEEDG